MIVLGINAYGHDAACVLLRDGEPLFAASEERFDRRRHSGAFPSGAIQAALDRAGISASEVDRVAFPWTRSMGRLPKLLHVLRYLPRSVAFLREQPDDSLPGRVDYLRRMRGLEGALRGHGLQAPLVRVPHHEAHAASAALALPEGDAAVLTADGMGEWTTTATWRIVDGNPVCVAKAPYPHSPGKAYAAITQWLGFRPESDEGKTMGLAPYGNEGSDAWRFARNLLTHDVERLLRVDIRSFDFPTGSSRLFGDAFLRELGEPREPDARLEQVHEDAARGMQDAVQEAFREIAKRLVDTTSCKALGLAGGLFLNCAMNGALLRALKVPVLPFPVAGDAGAAWGAAARVHGSVSKTAPSPLATLRLGHEIAEAEVDALLGAEASRPVDLVADVASLIQQGKLVGVARGRAEFGPRALGGRSVLASPTTSEIRDRLNAHKGREAWRPLAPVVLVEDKTLFRDLVPSPWMILTFFATEMGRRLVPGAVHVDGTARVQTVGPDDDPFLRALLARLRTLGHPPCVLNTSLNRRGEPIVNTAEEALGACRAMRLDAVVLGDALLPLSGS